MTFLLIGWSLMAAQVGGTKSQSSEPADSGQVWGNNLGFEPVGPGDLIYVSVTGSPELSRSSRVTPDGKLTLPLLSTGVTVAGLTPAKIAKAVSTALVMEKVLVDPIVSAEVLEYRSRRISVVGAVRMPGDFQAIGEMRLLDAIARAQGFMPDAGPEVIVSTANRGQGGEAPLHIPIKALLAGKDPSLNVLLQGGEDIRVPEAPKLFIVGNVKMPGSYALTDIEGSSVLKALALSQGVLPFAGKQAFVYRLHASGKREEIPIALRQILHRRAPDFPLQANDILYIPDSPGMRLSATTLEHIAGFGSSV
ncbi:MAG: polysaccharide biosynthesis/export family protein, partial [Acidobacteriaceae bacterium]|nr:polysaccharide biosynthesis/export family protein [Acidobacteriaceae bacterium]